MAHDSPDLDTLSRMMIGDGMPSPAASEELRSEVRTNESFPIISKPTDPIPGVFMGGVVIQWTYSLGLDTVREFHAWLAANEKDIERYLSDNLPGCHYKGTYVAARECPANYTTFWAYDSYEAIKRWSSVVADRGEFFDLMVTFRGYWIKASDARDRIMQPAQLYDAKVLDTGGENPFFAVTVAAAEKP